MNKRKATAPAATLLCCLVLVSVVLAQASANYELQRRVLANAGGAMDSANYGLNFTLGQPSAIGPSYSSNFGLYAGYWAGAVPPVPLPELSMQKDVTALVVAPGTPITYTIIVSNAGGGSATGAVLSDTMPSGVTFAGPVTLDPPGAGTVGTPPILVSGAIIAAGGSITVTAPVTVNTCLSVGTMITNTAAVSSTEVPTPVESSVPSTVANARPMLGTVDPSSGSGPSGVMTTFTTTWKDSNCWQDLKHCYFHIGASPSIVGNVTLLYNAAKNKLWLRSNDGTYWLGGLAPGSGSVLENGQAKVYCALTTVQGSGDTLSVTWAIEFKAGFEGTKKLGLKCKDRSKAKAKGKWKGTWTIE
jgi:uncharacterized repeat protein (TIGR01451 family)